MCNEDNASNTDDEEAVECQRNGMDETLAALVTRASAASGVGDVVIVVLMLVFHGVDGG